jgi:hypothetical protein
MTDRIEKKRTPRRWFGATLLLLILTLAIGALTWQWAKNSSMSQVSAVLESARPWMTVWRMALFGLVIGYWPRWIGWLAKKKHWSAAELQERLDVRGRVALWWLAIELIVMQNTLGLILGLLQ